MNENSFDSIVLGGGVMGLSIARELAGAGQTVALVERDRVGRSASWAGAGILPFASPAHASHPTEQLQAESCALHERLAADLRDETGIDNGYHKCGALVVARTDGEVASVMGQSLEWQASGVPFESVRPEEIADRFPLVAGASPSIRAAAYLPNEAQIRNPRHLQALVASCRARGVVIYDQSGESILHDQPGSAPNVELGDGTRLAADHVCIAAGSWSAALLEPLGISISIVPVRGQMVLYRVQADRRWPIVYEGTRYVVPRDDGYVLVGSTVEEAGFDCSTTEIGIREIQAFALSLVPALTADHAVNQWAGLRPTSWDGLPYIGPVPGMAQTWTACGHFRNGLLQSVTTAIMVRNMIMGEKPLIDPGPFRPDRG